MEKKVYVITRGEYSDYDIVAIYTKEEDAKVVVDLINEGESYDRAVIETWDLDANLKDIRGGKTPWFVRLSLETGNVSEIHRDSSPYSRVEGSISKDALGGVYTTVWADTQERAIKVASERRAQFIALTPSISVDAPTNIV